MDTTARTRLEIELQLRLHLIPRTDNRDALVDLGFAPAYPQLADDPYYGAIWTRAVEAHHDSKPGQRSELKMLVIERALYGGAHPPRRTVSRRIGACVDSMVSRILTHRPRRSRKYLDAASVLSVRTIFHRSPASSSGYDGANCLTSNIREEFVERKRELFGVP